MHANLPDDVLDGIRRRDPEAFAACYEAFADRLYRYLLVRCGDVALAEDLVEATFLELVEAAPALVGGTAAVRAWLFRAGRNNFLDAVRKARRRGDLPLDEAAARARPSPDPGPEEHAIAADHAAVLRDALAALNPAQREVLTLRFLSDLSGPEVAAVTGRRVGAVKALQHRALRALERVLRERGQLESLHGVVATGRNASRGSRAEADERTFDPEPES